MAFAALCGCVLAALAVTERGCGRLFFATAAFLGIAALLLLAVGDMERAVGLAAVFAVAVIGASKVKYHHSGAKLTMADLALASAGTVPFLVVQYRRATAGVVAGALALILAAGVTLLDDGGTPLPYDLRLLVVAAAATTCAFAWRLDGAASFRQTLRQRGAPFSTFMASVIDVASWWPSHGLDLKDLAQDPLPLMRATPARSTVRPDIIFIQHESVFDPRLFGLPVDPNVAAFLAPANSLSGRLHVDIYGGGSWQSEFSVMTGLSSAIFGADAYFIFKKGAGRFHHTLPRELAALGYRTMLTSSCRRGFLNYDAFYGSIGIAERIFSDDFPPPFDVDAFEDTSSDAIFLEAALGAFAGRISADPSPRFAYALTNFNHGPHDRPRAQSAGIAAERAFAAASLPDPQYVEYYSRLAETAAAWRQMKAHLAATFPGRPMLIVHYGDHQPVMTRRIESALRLPEDERRCFQTFYAIEGLNFAIDRPAVHTWPVLDIAFLGTVALQAAGLPLDEISATRAGLMEDCAGGYFAADSPRKRRFHQTLVDLSLIDLAPVVRGGTGGA